MPALDTPPCGCGFIDRPIGPSVWKFTLQDQFDAYEDVAWYVDGALQGSDSSSMHAHLNGGTHLIEAVMTYADETVTCSETIVQ